LNVVALTAGLWLDEEEEVSASDGDENSDEKIVRMMLLT